MGAPHVFHDQETGPGAVAYTAAKECTDQEESVVQLDLGARESDLIAEPVNVKEGTGKLEEDKDRRIEVYEWTLLTMEPD